MLRVGMGGMSWGGAKVTAGAAQDTSQARAAQTFAFLPHWDLHQEVVGVPDASGPATRRQLRTAADDPNTCKDGGTGGDASAETGPPTPGLG